jgi:hypothetical protein
MVRKEKTEGQIWIMFLVEHGLNYSLQIGDVVLDYVPNFFHVNTEVIVDEHIAESSNCAAS